MTKTIKKLAFVILLFSVLAWAADPNPAEYTINVHVGSSRMVIEGTSLAHQQRVSAVIDGKKCELESDVAVNQVLALGDYKAKLIQNEHKNAYDSFQIYEFLFPDKKTRKFWLVGLSE